MGAVSQATKDLPDAQAPIGEIASVFCDALVAQPVDPVKSIIAATALVIFDFNIVIT